MHLVARITTLLSVPAYMHDASRLGPPAPRPAGLLEAGVGGLAAPQAVTQVAGEYQVLRPYADGLRCNAAAILAG